MPVQDKDPERRNLMVTSLGFVAYYLAGGHVVENQIRIQVINISFDSPMVLAVMAWLMLFWFALRYWQTRKGRTIDYIRNGLIALSERKCIINYVTKKTGLKHNKKDGFSIFRLHFQHNEYFIVYSLVLSLRTNSDGTDSPVLESKEIKLRINKKEYIGFVLLLKLFALSAFHKPEFTTHAMPYVFFYFALTIALIRYFFIAC